MVRYSGDVIVRVQHLHGTLYAYAITSHASPVGRWKGTAEIRRLGGTSPDDYDLAAAYVLIGFERRRRVRLPLERAGGGMPAIRRVFHAPCPVPGT